MGYFEEFGASFQSTISTFAEGTSSTLIDNLAIPMSICLTLYFVCKGYLIMAGRIQDSLPDLMLSCGKIALISLFALNSGYFIGYVLPAIQGLEDFFISSFAPVDGQQVDNRSAWASIDALWSSFIRALSEVWNLMGVFGLTNIPAILAVFFIWLVFGLLCVFFTFSAVGVLLINEVCLTVTLGFGPVFLCCLMFPVTRTWFDGWLKSTITYIFTVIIAAAVMLMFTVIFDQSIQKIISIAQEPETADSLFRMCVPLLNFGVLALTAATMIRLVPSVAAGMTGGVAMQAVGVGQMVGGIGKGMTTMTGAGLVGMGAGLGMQNLQKTGYGMLHGQSLSQNGNLAHAATGAVLGLGARATGAVAGATARALKKPAEQLYQKAQSALSEVSFNPGIQEASDRMSSDTTTQAGNIDAGSGNTTMSATEASANSQNNARMADQMLSLIPEQYQADPNFNCPANYQGWLPKQFENFASQNPGHPAMSTPGFHQAYQEAQKTQWRLDHFGATGSQIPEAYRADPNWTCPKEYEGLSASSLYGLMQASASTSSLDYSQGIPDDLEKAYQEVNKREWREAHFGRVQ